VILGHKLSNAPTAVLESLTLASKAIPPYDSSPTVREYSTCPIIRPFDIGTQGQRVSKRSILSILIGAVSSLIIRITLQNYTPRGRHCHLDRLGFGARRPFTTPRLLTGKRRRWSATDDEPASLQGVVSESYR
jgi:hypothetical protein